MNSVFHLTMNNMQCFSDNCDCNGGLDAGNVSPRISFRPRGVLARTLYEKQKHDEYLNRLNKREVSLKFKCTICLIFIDSSDSHLLCTRISQHVFAKQMY